MRCVSYTKNQKPTGAGICWLMLGALIIIVGHAAAISYAFLIHHVCNPHPHSNAHSHSHQSVDKYKSSRALTPTSTSLDMTMQDHDHDDDDDDDDSSKNVLHSLPNENEEQHFLFKLEDNHGTCLDPKQYLTIETTSGLGSCGHDFLPSSSGQQEEEESIGSDNSSCNKNGNGNSMACHWVKVMYADPRSHRLEFTVKAKKKIRNRWKLGIYPIQGRRRDLSQRNSKIGDIIRQRPRPTINTHSQRESGAAAIGAIFAEDALDDAQEDEDDYCGMYSPKYWEKAEGKQIRIGGEACTIVANELPDECF